jgi:N-carbamoyl-L-amino-acid hydrolase
MTDLKVSIDRIRRDIEHLATLGATPEGGVSRTSYSAADRQARQWLHDECERYGLHLRTDGIGNMFVELHGLAEQPGPTVYTGSHLDSVPNGGRYDGIVGAIAALEVMRGLAEARPALRYPVAAVIFADEEGNYHHLNGSTALVRNYTWDELQTLRGRDGDLLIDAIAAMGWDPQQATNTQLNPAQVAAFLELHVEQGPVLETSGTDIGVVTSIVGLGAAHLDFTGSQDHAGTTPMALRQDPMPAAGAFLSQLGDIAASVSESAVLTCGLTDIEPGGTNVVPQRARLYLDFRDTSMDRLHRLEQAITRAAEEAAAQHRVESQYHRLSLTEPVATDEQLQTLISRLAESRGFSTRRMHSGAGHDAQNMARITPTGMIFIPSIGGKSHSPQEYSTWDSIEKGATVLLDAVLELANSG